jgi:hypothetical protein
LRQTTRHRDNLADDGATAIAVRFSRASAAAAFAERFADMCCERVPHTVVYAAAAAGEAFFRQDADRALRWPADADDENWWLFRRRRREKT